SKSRKLALLFREFRDAVTGQSKNRPFIHRFRTELPVELNSGIVPIEHRPFHAAAAAFACDFCRMNEQCATVTFAAHLRFHEQIFEIKTRATKPGGKVVKENGEANCGVFFEYEHNFSGRSWAEQNLDKLFLGCGHFVRRQSAVPQ